MSILVFLVLLSVILGATYAQECSCQDSSFRDCSSVSYSDVKVWDKTGGVFDIYPKSLQNTIEVYCDLVTDGGGWTVLQRRQDGTENFHRGWADYVKGFGNARGEFWLGLEKIHQMTKDHEMELRIDLEDWDGSTSYAVYSTFLVGDASTQYQLNVGGHSGGAKDQLSYNDGAKFSTFNYDSDLASGNCSKERKGGWWYKFCSPSNVNGIYYVGGAYTSENTDGAHWDNDWYSMKFIEMKFRPKV